MRAELPRLPRFFRRRTHLAAFDAGKEHARHARLSGMTLAVHGAEVEEFVAEGVALFLLCKQALEGQGKLAQAGGLRPGAIAIEVGRKFEIGEQPAAAMGAFFEAGHELIRENLAEDFELIGG
jgi:hypothetical protein